MSHQALEYEEIIRSHDGRVTPQRLIILDAICAGNGHTTFAEIFARIEKDYPPLHRMTLYRALDFFLQIGLVVSAQIEDETYYEIVRSEPHHHLRCEKCKTIFEIPHDMLKAAFDAIEHTYGFVVHMDHFMLVGLCSACQEDDAG